jgi:predicted Rossmann fold nucleotide-binding protein DprA/Smf involved in DNA uptake
MSKATLVRKITRTDPDYPVNVTIALGRHSPAELQAIGEMSLLRQPTLALVCSLKCPGSIILATHIFATRTSRSGPVVVGGFHSPMERQCLDLLIRRRVPAVVCPARSIEKIRLPVAWKNAISTNHLLVLSQFPPGRRRATTEQALMRNEFVGALADQILIPHARPASKTEQLALKLMQMGKRVLTFHDNRNERLLQLGAQPFDGLLHQNDMTPSETTEAWFSI